MTCLFTIISEYKGGTYVHQVSAADPADAFAVWADQMTRDTILSADEKDAVSGGGSIFIVG